MIRVITQVLPLLLLVVIITWRFCVLFWHSYGGDRHVTRQHELHGWRWWRYSRSSCDLPCRCGQMIRVIAWRTVILILAGFGLIGPALPIGEAGVWLAIWVGIVFYGVGLAHVLRWAR